jgi:hypothetical protein
MHSTVRQKLGMPFPGKAVVRSVMLADVRLAESPPDVLTASTAGDCFCFIAPFGDGWYRVIAWDRRNQPPESTPVSLAEISGVTRQVLGTDFGMRDPRWMSRFHSEECQVPTYRAGRVLLAGDAAHVHSPAGGQGMNTSIQDAANLGWKLAATVQGWAPEGLLDSYDAERHPVGRQVLRQSGALLRIGLTGPPPLVDARKLLAAAATRIPFAVRVLAKGASGIAISYRAPRGAHPIAGKRAPDLLLDDSRRLYEALRGGRFVLAADGPLPPGAMDGYGDRVTAVTTASATGTLILVRPDAYIAWASDSAAARGVAGRGTAGRGAGAERAAARRLVGRRAGAESAAGRSVAGRGASGQEVWADSVAAPAGAEPGAGEPSGTAVGVAADGATDQRAGGQRAAEIRGALARWCGGPAPSTAPAGHYLGLP